VLPLVRRPAHLLVRRQCAQGVLPLDRRLLAVVGHRLPQPRVINRRHQPVGLLGAPLLYARIVRQLDVLAIPSGHHRRMRLFRTRPLPCAR